jgi:hypothetical protein
MTVLDSFHRTYSSSERKTSIIQYTEIRRHLMVKRWYPSETAAFRLDTLPHLTPRHCPHTSDCAANLQGQLPSIFLLDVVKSGTAYTCRRHFVSMLMYRCKCIPRGVFVAVTPAFTYRYHQYLQVRKRIHRRDPVHYPREWC